MEKKPVWTDEYEVRVYETGPAGTCHLTTLCNYLQETAGHHAAHLGLGMNDLADRNRMWVLFRFRVSVKRYPRMHERIIAETWPRGMDGLMAIRDFELCSGEDGILASASSAWIVMDTATKRPCRIPDYFLKVPVNPSRQALPGGLKKLEDVKEGIPSEHITVHHGDLDCNNHVNNTKYIGWIIDQMYTLLPPEKVCRAFEINFLSECARGDILSINSAPAGADPLTYRHSITRVGDGKEACRAASVWG